MACTQRLSYGDTFADDTTHGQSGLFPKIEFAASVCREIHLGASHDFLNY